MNAAAVAFIAMLVTSTAVNAAGWVFFENEDPISDEKTGVVGFLNNEIGVSFKCWKGDPKETLLLILTRKDYSDNDALTIKARTDKNAVREVSMRGRNSSEKQSYYGVAGIDDDVPALISELKSAKTRFVIEVDGQVHVLPVAGAAKAVSKMTALCEANG